MWKKTTEETPPYYKKLWVWVDNEARKASFTSEHEFIYWDEDGEPKGFPTHWVQIEPPESKPMRVCF